MVNPDPEVQVTDVSAPIPEAEEYNRYPALRKTRRNAVFAHTLNPSPWSCEERPFSDPTTLQGVECRCARHRVEARHASPA